jgi:hypothetical protein
MVARTGGDGQIVLCNTLPVLNAGRRVPAAAILFPGRTMLNTNCIGPQEPHPISQQVWSMI